MIDVMVRLRVDDWGTFQRVHDEPAQMEARRQSGNLSHRVLSQLDDPTDVVFLDAWSSPQDSDDFYHTDGFQELLRAMGGSLVEIIKLEDTQAASIESPTGPA
jgi:quinol monooxygenase YgiN